MLGNCAVGKPAMETKPTITMRMAITMATIRRRMKKLATDHFPFSNGSRFHIHLKVGKQAPSFPPLTAANRQNEFKDLSPSRQFPALGDSANCLGELHVFPFTDSKVSFDRVHLRDGGERSGGPDQV